MKRKGLAALLMAGLIAGALAGSPGVASAGKAKGKKKKTAGPVVVGKDDPADWGSNQDATLAPIGNALGQELVQAAIGMNGKDKIDFIIGLKSLPAIGGTPEVSRYSWYLNVDGDEVQLDGKFTNYSRGVCDPTSGQCPPPRDPGLQPFMVRGNCEATQNITLCEELGIVQGVFDPAKATITVPVPMELINAKPGSKITPGTNIFGGSISAAPSAFLTMSSFPMDTLTVTKTFVIPSGKKK